VSESPYEDLSKNAQNISKQSVSQEPPNADIHFHMHMEALFNMLLTTINRP